MARTSSHPATLDDLECRHDGPPPAGALRVTVLGGRLRAEAHARVAGTLHHQRLAAEARLGTARRRIALSGAAAVEDAWLARLTATLAHHRHAATREYLNHRDTETQRNAILRASVSLW